MKKIPVYLREMDFGEGIQKIAGENYLMCPAASLDFMRRRTQAGKEPIAAVILDGARVSPQELKSLRRDVYIDFPIMIVTDTEDEEQTAAYLQAGADDVMLYPLDLNLLEHRLQNLMRLYESLVRLEGLDRDALTGLYSRNTFYEKAAMILAHNPGRSYDLVLSDIENFNGINAHYGEEVGDQLLRHIGGWLNRQGDGDGQILYARYGGDQFVALIDHDLRGRSAVTDRNEIEKMIITAPVERFEIKFGIYENVDRSMPVSQMCDKALLAVRSIKHQYGHITAVYTEEMQKLFIREQQIREDMELSLERKEFVVYYQPKHGAVDGALMGAEALIRWNHPQFGFMPPADFIPLFEQNGFISQIDKYVWQTVCADQAEWIRKGIPVVPISVNVCRRDLVLDGFFEAVSSSMQENRIDPGLLHMEITESNYVENADVLIPIVNSIQEMGIRIELDDFGSGFSSLGVLSRLPLDIIKLDMSFIKELDSRRQIVESMIQLAYNLKYTTVAEGVETQEQLDILKAMGCNYIQGYHFSKPLPKAEFERYLIRHAAKKTDGSLRLHA